MSDLVVEYRLTYDAEGTNDPESPYYSRRVHWPGGASGVTIGRGYDMRYRVARQVHVDMTRAGVPWDEAQILARGALLTAMSDPSAGRWVKDDPQHGIEITVDAQEALFAIAIVPIVADVARLLSKDDVVARYGRTPPWESLDRRIRGMLVDLRYRGDFTPTARKALMPVVVKTDLAGLARVMSDRSLWAAVPTDRFERRAAYLRGGHS
jgi:hypothetical protein